MQATFYKTLDNKNVINILLENNANERIKDIDGKVPSDYYIKNQNNKEEETKNIDNKVVIVDKNKLNINVFIKENIESIGNRIYIVGYHDQNYNLNEKKLNMMNQEHRKLLEQEMINFLFEGKDVHIEGYTPPEKQ